MFANETEWLSPAIIPFFGYITSLSIGQCHNSDNIVQANFVHKKIINSNPNLVKQK